MAKILITTIQGNLVPNPSEAWRSMHNYDYAINYGRTFYSSQAIKLEITKDKSIISCTGT